MSKLLLKDKSRLYNEEETKIFGNIDKNLLLLLLLFVLMGHDDFDTTQLLLALALFSTLGDQDDRDDDRDDDRRCRDRNDF